jgi:hypothetical protein
MTEAKLKAKEMVDAKGLESSKVTCKHLISVCHYLLQLDPTEANSHAFQYWGDVMDELNEMEA